MSGGDIDQWLERADALVEILAVAWASGSGTDSEDLREMAFRVHDLETRLEEVRPSLSDDAHAPILGAEDDLRRLAASIATHGIYAAISCRGVHPDLPGRWAEDLVRISQKVYEHRPRRVAVGGSPDDELDRLIAEDEAIEAGRLP